MSALLPEEEQAEAMLKALGVGVRRVETSNSKTPEFLVDGDARGYAVEVKARRDSEHWRRSMDTKLVAHQKRSMGYGRWGEDVAREALKQLRSVDAAHSRWWVLWLAIRCNASKEAMFEEAIGSLFGVRQVVYSDPTSQITPMRSCLFARPGVFERYPDIVASVIDCGSGLGFCVNEFAPEFSSFCESALCSSFAHIHAPTSASELVENASFFRVDDLSMNRKDDAALAAYIEQAYGVENAIVLDMEVHSTSMAVPRSSTRLRRG